MRYVITLCIVLNSCVCIAQELKTAVMYKAYEQVEGFGDTFKMYMNNCNDTIFNNEINRIVNNKEHITVSLSCIMIKDSAILNRIYKALLSKEDLNKKIGLVNIASYKNASYYSYVLVFSKRSFIKYNRKKRKERVYIIHPAGKVKIKHKVVLAKYANSYLINLNKDFYKIESMD